VKLIGFKRPFLRLSLLMSSVVWKQLTDVASTRQWEPVWKDYME